MRYGFVIDNRRCIGCHACTVACKAEHNVPVGVSRTWVKTVEKGVFPNTRRIFAVHRCNHCGDAPCVQICPVTALFTRRDGIVDFDSRRCIGCKSCMQACPYDALYIDPETHTSAKCNYCAHRIDSGLEPACVIVCPVHAIVSGDMENPASEIARVLSRQQVVPRKPEKNTLPNLFYIDGDHAALRPEQAPAATEFSAVAQATGVGHYAAFASRPPHQGSLRSPAARAKVLGLPGGSAGGEGAAAGGGPPANGSGNPDGAAAFAAPAGAARRTYDAPAKGVLWDWEVSGYLWSKSIAAGALFLPLALELGGALTLPDRLSRVLVVLSLLFLGLTGALLVKDLDRPERFLYVLLRPNWRSWLVRGAYIITGFGGVSFLWGLHLFAGGTLLSGAGLALVKGLLLVLGVLAAVYTAFLFAQARARDLWQSPLLPFHMLIASAMTGGAVALLVAHLGGLAPAAVLAAALQGAIVLNLALLALELGAQHASHDSAAAIHQITRGALALPFWAALLLGNLAPLAMLWLR
ncbi:MAG: 4Fe-4S dicluster domain-containing protein, partial [bacterium]